jgi:hypothetical protein
MSHGNQELKEALGTIWGLVYRATQVPYLPPDQTERLRGALRIVSEGREGDDFFNHRANYMCECVLSCGVVSAPSRTPKGTQEILEDCQSLTRYLERQQ